MVFKFFKTKIITSSRMKMKLFMLVYKANHEKIKSILDL